MVKGDRVQARGSADDKGQIMIHLPAVEALLASRGGLPVNLKFAFEGEEENGSEHLDAWLEENRDRLRGNVAIISDTSFFDGNLPAITIGLRGLMAAQIDVIGPSSTFTPAPTAARSRTRSSLSPRSSPPSRARTAGSASPASTTTCACSPTSTARRSASSRSTSGPTSS